MLSHPIHYKIHPNFRGVKMWGKKTKMCTQTQLNMVFSPPTGSCIKRRPLLKSNSASASTVPFMHWGFWTLTDSTGHTALCAHVYMKKKQPIKLKLCTLQLNPFKRKTAHFNLIASLFYSLNYMNIDNLKVAFNLL